MAVSGWWLPSGTTEDVTDEADGHEPREELRSAVGSHDCNATGLDESHWSGRCALCDGSGEREYTYVACARCGHEKTPCGGCGGVECDCEMKCTCVDVAEYDEAPRGEGKDPHNG